LTKIRDFVYQLLRPILATSVASRDLKIMVFDDNRGGAYQAARYHFYNDPAKAAAIDGIATHW
jgi:O-glycosyl hydrolase